MKAVRRALTEPLIPPWVMLLVGLMLVVPRWLSFVLLIVVMVGMMCDPKHKRA